jgi:hypothetical protein
LYSLPTGMAFEKLARLVFGIGVLWRACEGRRCGEGPDGSDGPDGVGGVRTGVGKCEG